MSIPKITFNGKEFDVVEGGKISLYDDQNTFGEWIKVNTSEFEFQGTRVSIEDNLVTYEITKVSYLTDTGSKTISEEKVVEEPVAEETPDFNKLKKADLIKIAEELGFDVSIKLTKKELIELIEGK